MAFQNFNHRDKLQVSNSRKQVMPKEDCNIVSTLDSSIESVKKYLKILTITQDINLQIKLFSMLSACLMSDKSCKETIILNNQIYVKVHNMLVKNRSQKASVLFNFLTTLTYTEKETCLKMKSLVIHAQNMIRVSGCLIYMTNMFIDGMVFRDTWTALCQCLAAACKDSEVNQSYCSHLVPVCISKCLQGGSEVMLLLESLLQNHNRNIKLFLDRQGLCLFSKETILDNAYMRVLNILMKNPDSAKFIVQKSDIVNDLRYVLDLYGADSQAGQWAVVILHHAAPYLQGVEEKEDVTLKLQNFPFEKSYATNIRNNNTHIVEELQGDNTQTIFQNLMQEIGYSRKHSEFYEFTKIFNGSTNENQIPLIQPQRTVENKRNFIKKQPVTIFGNKMSKMQAKQNTNKRFGCTKTLSSSFLAILESTPKSYNKYINEEVTDMRDRNGLKRLHENKGHSFVVKDMENFQLNGLGCEQGDNLDNFRPTLTSTPNNSNGFRRTFKRSSRSIYESRKAMRKRLSETKRQQPYNKTSKTEQRSMSSRLFSAINDSCANIFNTVKNIFKSKESNCELNETNVTRGDNADCSFSFTNYMRQRDEYVRLKSNAIPKNTIHNFSYRNDTCLTCNDTFYLKDKFSNNEYLQQTVKKLKVGINLYGCDFKKIARALWPNEAYMTPVVLYNLYRKLLLK